MFDLGPVQAALREFGLDGWLLYDFRGQQPAGPADPRPRRPEAGHPPLLLLRPRPGRRRPSWSTGSSPAPSTTCPARSRSTSAGRSWRPASPSLVAGPVAGGDGILAPERQPVHLAGRRRDRRAGPVLRRRGRPLGRPDPAVRVDLGRRPVGHAPGGRRGLPVGLRRGLRPDRRAGPRPTGRSRRPRSSGRSSTTSTPTA